MITINVDKAKQIAHEKRRVAREVEFAPYDDIIAKQIPGTDFTVAEAARQAIRDKYAEMQNAINAATTPEEIKAAMPPQPTE